MAPSNGFRANPTVLHASPPAFPPPPSSQPPNPGVVERAILNPPFVWKGIPLRSFRCTSDGDLSSLAPPEEKGHFLSLSHKKRYKSLKKHLHQDLEDMARRHKVENKLESAIRVAVEERETADFHEDFTRRLEWGDDSSSLLLGHDVFSDAMREGGMLENGASGLIRNSGKREDPCVAVARFSENGQGSPFPSVRNYFRHYPGISISLTVTDFYRRLERKREEFGNALEFQQMWEWSERHWNFFEAVSHLRNRVQSEEADGNGKSETPEVANNPMSGSPGSAEDPEVVKWTPKLEARKRRHQWAILRRIMAAFEINKEDFPEVCAPGGRTLDRYFSIGKYGVGGGEWYPVDRELEGKGKGGIKEAMEQIDCFEDVLASGGGLAEASMAVIKRCQERDSRVTLGDYPTASNKGRGGSSEEAPAQQDLISHVDPEPQSRPPAEDRASDTALKGDQGPPGPLDDASGSAVLNTRVFISALRGRFNGAETQPDAAGQPVQGWFESWRNPKVHIRPLLRP